MRWEEERKMLEGWEVNGCLDICQERPGTAKIIYFSDPLLRLKIHHYWQIKLSTFVQNNSKHDIELEESLSCFLSFLLQLSLTEDWGASNIYNFCKHLLARVRVRVLRAVSVGWSCCCNIYPWYSSCPWQRYGEAGAVLGSMPLPGSLVVSSHSRVSTVWAQCHETCLLIPTPAPSHLAIMWTDTTTQIRENSLSQHLYKHPVFKVN